MLLKHLYDLAHSRQLLGDLAFAPKAVRWVIELDASGDLVGAGPVPTGDDKRGKEFSCPQTTRPKVAGGVSEFLADGLTAVFGLDPDPTAPMPEKKRLDRDQNNASKRNDFWRQVDEAASATQDPRLAALRRFGQSLASCPPSFLRWGKVIGEKADGKPAWWLSTASGAEVRLKAETFTFRVAGELLIENECIRAFWRDRHAQEVSAARQALTSGLCLVSGEPARPLAQTHNPKIQGVPNTQSFGAAIVSFDKAAFASYGFDQSLNAPTSDEAATAYCVALNWLLNRDDHSLRLGQTSLCFWAKSVEASGTLFSRLLNRPDPQAVAQFLNSPWAGLDRELARCDDFFVVTLAGNSGRIVVRHWLQQPLEQAVEHFCAWFEDLALRVPDRPQKAHRAQVPDKQIVPALAVFRLACATVRDAKDLPSEIPAQLYRAALEGTAPSVALVKSILDQLHSRLVRDDDYHLLYDESRFALLKLILNRNRKDSDMEIKPELTADTDDPAYNCGRLLAILADAQAKAHEYNLQGAGIAERYFGTACTSPASVFPLLLRLDRHHLKKISKSQRFAGHERFIEQRIQEVSVRFRSGPGANTPAFPRHLDLQAQGRFALGFYQQMAADALARQANRTVAAVDPSTQ